MGNDWQSGFQAKPESAQLQNLVLNFFREKSLN